MEFWGVEVKAGEPLKVNPGEGRIIHLSQTSLGESKKDKGSETVPLFLKVDDQKLVLGTLSSVNFPQLSFDLVFEKEFELSHNWKNGSVFFCGYRAYNPEEGGFDGDSDPESLTDSEEEEEDIPVISKENGKAVPKGRPVSNAVAAKPVSGEKQVKLVDPSKDDDDSDEEDTSSDEDMLDSNDDDDDDDSEDEETPKKAEPSKKRPSESATKTPVAAKRAKAATPQKTDGKKGGHTATPHPAKKAGKTPANDQVKPQTPKSGGQFSCKSCSKTFGSETGLGSHTKAKHSAN